LVALSIAACLGFACSKKEPPPPEATEPWPAQAPSSNEPAGKATRYQIEERGVARLSLKARDATPRGELRVARGELDIHLQNLARTRGTVSVDVASISMLESGDAGPRDATNAARSWLNVGSNRPEAEIERTRWAKFEILRIDEVSVDTPALGRKVKLALPPDAGPDADASDAAPAPSEARSVRLVATGALTFNGMRVERRVSLEAVFVWRAGDSSSAPPDRVQIRTRRPLVVELAAHDVAPRDESGRRTPGDDKWLGKLVGREARVELELSAKLSRK
jgi:hypothetical protein